MHPRPTAGRPRRTGLPTAIERLEPRTLLAAATLLRDINPGGDARFNEPVAVGPAFFFSADDGAHGSELWKTDGTPEGTVLVKDIRPGPEGSIPRTLTAVNGTLFFVADDGATGSELWRSDGTEAGTGRVKDANPGSGSGVGIDFRMAELNGTLIFTGDDGTGPRLWRSDGTDAGTAPFAPGANIWSVAPFGGAVALSLHGYAYRTDGTASGTYPLTPDGIRDSNGRMVPAGGKLYFCGADPASLSGDTAILWVSDGTPGAAHPVSDKVKFGATGVVAAANGFVYFFAFGAGDLRHSLWRTDGTDAGTVRLKELDLELPDEIYFGPGNDMAALGDTLLFTDGAFDSGNGQRPVEVLWKSDGTPRGTVALGMTARSIGEFDAVAGRMYVGTYDSGTTGLWETNGTRSGTRPVALTAGEGGPPLAASVLAAVGEKVLLAGVVVGGAPLPLPLPMDPWVFTPGPPPGSGPGQDDEAPAADLVVSVPPVKQEVRYAGGPALIPLDVTNRGQGAVRGSARVKVQLSADETPDAADPEAVVAKPLRLRLSPGATRRFNVKVTLPVTAPGEYRVAVVLDPDNQVPEVLDNNNGAVSADSVEVIDPVAPLWDYSMDLHWLHGGRGRRTVTFFLRNDGGSTARGVVSIDAVLSPRTSNDPSKEVPVGHVRKRVTVKPSGGAPGRSTRVMVPVVLPMDLPPGEYNLTLAMTPDPAWSDRDPLDNHGSYVLELA